ncbi:glycosyltransferase [Flavobacterium sp. KACC 22763]|uniref:glycosyltransferase n=1 Tax=Flavobacterium sp. KACC 22763 TaxID=3025668 RepID=UPI0023656E20|nr:glycosyltransferase [Flavobacterium sp. KACC 22763]WDF62860.1 glycosyltransferase [Flavobacterium sp. KACC 22763]
MKIGILVYRMRGIGGIERITAEKINAWIEMFGYEVVLITKNETDLPVFYNINDKCKRYNLNISTKSSGGIRQYIKNIPKGIELYRQVKKILECENIDVLFTTMISMDSLIIPFIKKEIPKIAEIHRSNYACNNKGGGLKNLIINKYDKVVLLNNDEKGYYRLNNLVVIPNFIDHQSSKQRISIKKNIIIYAGRIVIEKQVNHLVDIWAALNSKNLGWEVHVYGDGNIKSLREKIVEKKIEQSFKVFPGTPEIKDKMQEAKIFVLMSKSEAFPMVLLEAMEAKLPIVSYDSPHGPKNIVSDGKDGFIVPLNDKIAFSEKLVLLMNDVLLREKFIENQEVKLGVFSKERVMNQWNDLVLELVCKN